MGRRSTQSTWVSSLTRTGIDLLIPSEKETLLLKDKRIARVIVFGTGRFLPGIILEPAQAILSPTEFIDSLWPTIEHINTLVPKHAQLLREMVLVQLPEKPFVLTEKYTAKDKDTLRLYEPEIDAAYARLES